MRHKTREMLVSQRTQLLNALRGHLTEVGVIAPQGPRHARELAELIEACDETIPFEVCEALAPLVVQLRNLRRSDCPARPYHRKAGAEGRNGASLDEHPRLRPDHRLGDGGDHSGYIQLRGRACGVVSP
jgi:hypothetical protein